MNLRVLPIGPRSFLIELGDLDQTLALFDAILADPVPGIAEIVPAARTLLVRASAGTVADAALAKLILSRMPAPGTKRPDNAAQIIELPMIYDGQDLDEVARHLDLTVAEVISAHQAATWQVAFCGFAPGFSYMTCDDPRFDLPRRSAPRTKIPAGSVALAARFCGIYPQDTPGGWQLIGRTEVPMWDMTRDPPALLQPGMRARFVQDRAPARTPKPTFDDATTQTAAGLTVLSTAFPVLFQDEGRPGQGGQGVSASGALDMGALHRANRAVGNPSNSAALEITLGPARLRADQPLTLALTGAALGAKVVAGDDQIAVPAGQAFALDAGDELLITPPEQGMRSYLALRGGYDVAPALGSASVDTLAFVGPKALSGGASVAAANRPATTNAAPEHQPKLPAAGDLVELPVILGPRADWFTPEMIAQFLAQEWLVTPQSSRVGIRLSGDQPLTRPDARELPSEGTELGAIQIPHSGQPVLFLADHPLTGGYPVIATVAPNAIDLAGQIPPGARIRFTTSADFAPILTI